MDQSMGSVRRPLYSPVSEKIQHPTLCETKVMDGNALLHKQKNISDGTLNEF